MKPNAVIRCGAAGFLAVLAVNAGLLSPVWAIEKAEKMTSLPDYLAMHRDEQLKLILRTRRAIALSFAANDYQRAKCVTRLFDATPEGDAQFYDTKGLLKAAATHRPNWKAEQVIAFRIKNSLCPEKQ